MLRLDTVEHAQCRVHAGLCRIFTSAHDPELCISATDEEPGSTTGLFLIVVHGSTAAATPISVPIPALIPPVAALLPSPPPIIVS
jgi:hypothetical protein